MGVQKKIYPLFLVLLFVCQFSISPRVSSSESQGTASQFSTFKLESEILKEERSMVVALPEGYEAGDLSYPVLYVLDAEGENNFSGTVATLNDLVVEKIASPMIVVGIRNTNRNRDMIPDSVAHRPGSGGSEKFLEFISDELMPYVKKNYRAREFSALYGMSNSAARRIPPG